ncbi:MAG: hypothetical protein ACREHG_02215 [Candidatus Saccharimonadales bacterium]
MAGTGIDISGKPAKAAFDLIQQGKHYEVVVTVCDAASAEKCPVFPGRAKRIAWSFPGPSAFVGTKEQAMAQTRRVRDAVPQKVEDFIQEVATVKFWI